MPHPAIYRAVTEEELAAGWFAAQLDAATTQLWRFEQQPVYAIDDEAGVYADWLAGRHTPPTAAPGLARWDRRVRALRERGVQIERVRVIDTPPTSYQQWLRWADTWNADAGEQITYLHRGDYERHVADLNPFGAADWWLVDGCRAVLMYFDRTGRRYRVDEVTGENDMAQAVEFAWHASNTARRLAESAALAAQRAA